MPIGVFPFLNSDIAAGALPWRNDGSGLWVADTITDQQTVTIEDGSAVVQPLTNLVTPSGVLLTYQLLSPLPDTFDARLEFYIPDFANPKTLRMYLNVTATTFLNALFTALDVNTTTLTTDAFLYYIDHPAALQWHTLQLVVNPLCPYVIFHNNVYPLPYSTDMITANYPPFRAVRIEQQTSFTADANSYPIRHGSITLTNPTLSPFNWSLFPLDATEFIPLQDYEVGFGTWFQSPSDIYDQGGSAVIKHSAAANVNNSYLSLRVPASAGTLTGDIFLQSTSTALSYITLQLIHNANDNLTVGFVQITVPALNANPRLATVTLSGAGVSSVSGTLNLGTDTFYNTHLSFNGTTLGCIVPGNGSTVTLTLPQEPNPPSYVAGVILTVKSSRTTGASFFVRDIRFVGLTN